MNENFFIHSLFEIPKNNKRIIPKIKKANTPAGLIYGDMVLRKSTYFSPNHSAISK